MKQSWVYIITNWNHKVLYTGVTSNLEKRIWEHINKVHPKSFTARYNVNKLVYIAEFSDIREAITWEKKVKGKTRRNKMILIERENPDWVNLSDGWFDSPTKILSASSLHGGQAE